MLKLLYLYNLGEIDLQAKIIIKEIKNEKNIETSVGRIIFNNVLPSDFRFVNEVIEKKSISKLINEILAQYGSERLAFILDNLKELGFRFATLSGLNIRY
jgi:DNA-directed RNA polymerase subunit beta'